MERGLKAFAGEEVPLYSFDPGDRDAIFNPFAAAEEFSEGAAVGAVLGGAQSAVIRASGAARRVADDLGSPAGQDSSRAAYLRRLEQLGHLPAEKSETAALDETAETAGDGPSRSHDPQESNGLRADKLPSSAESPSFHTFYDPIREKEGSAFVSHPKKMSKILKSLEKRGIGVEYRPGSMSYSPGFGKGQPGHLIMDSDASYSAWLHELQHLADDEASGWRGMRILTSDPQTAAAKQLARGRRAS